MTRLKMLGCVVAIAVIGGTAAHFAGGVVLRALNWLTPVAMGAVVGFWLAKL